MIKLSCVLITKDQDWNIDRLLTSVLSATHAIGSSEVVLVDSASTDQTIAIARRHPITIIQFAAGQRLTPAAGRYVGYQHSTGELVLFLDGDMELRADWLPAALELLDARPAVGGLSGNLIHLPRHADSSSRPSGVEEPIYGERGYQGPPIVTRLDDGLVEVTHGGGATLYRRSVLEEVGSFNPHLLSEEEPELCLRIRRAGHQLLRTEPAIAYHYTDPAGGPAALFARWRRGLFTGAGQNMRYHLGSPLLGHYLRERPHARNAVGMIVASLLLLVVAAVLREWRWLIAWPVVGAVFMVKDALRQRSLRAALISSARKLLVAEATIRGFLKRPRDPQRLDARFSIVREMPEHD